MVESKASTASTAWRSRRMTGSGVPGDTLTVRAADVAGDGDDFDVLLLGGLPIREPIAHYGPFLMNTKAQLVEAMDDFQNGKMGTIPDDAR